MLLVLVVHSLIAAATAGRLGQPELSEGSGKRSRVRFQALWVKHVVLDRPANLSGRVIAVRSVQTAKAEGLTRRTITPITAPTAASDAKSREGATRSIL